MKHVIISLDGNIGAGKTTLLNEIRKSIPEIHYVDEPVGQWTALRNETGKNLLELFYEDKKRWSYTFQNCAILTRLINIQKAVDIVSASASASEPQIILTERSILTDKYVFAEMLRRSGDIDGLEWDLYNSWFDTFGSKLPTKAIIYLSTSAETAKKRIGVRNRAGEDLISLDYLHALDEQHKKWVYNTDLPTLILSTEDNIPVEENIQKIKLFIDKLRNSD
jgi:deoxyadenosine/deoxycytidine kinase